MRFFKVAVVVFFIATVLLCTPTTFSQSDGSSLVTVRNGNWAKYIGSFPYEEYEWIELTVLQVKESTVDISMRYDLRVPYRTGDEYFWQDHPMLSSIDVRNGDNNIFLFLIPANLSVGGLVPVPDKYPNLTIGRVESKEYGGSRRTVLLASYANTSSRNTGLGGDGTMVWDKETGVLVEIISMVNNYAVTSLKLTETNLWSVNIAGWIADNSFFIVLVLSCLGALMVFVLAFLKIGKRIPTKVTHPMIGRVLMGLGVFLFGLGIVNLSAFNQMITSVSLAFAPILFMAGVLVYNGSWVALARDKLVVDVGTVLLAAALMLIGIIIACAVYREIGAMVPYAEIDLRPFFIQGTQVPHQMLVEGVFLYPYAWLASPLIACAVVLAGVGVLFKSVRRY